MFKVQGRLLLTAVLGSTCGSLLVGYQTHSGDQESGSVAPHVQIRMFNIARVSKRDLSQAEREVTRIFAQAEISVGWAEGSPADRASLITDFSANNSTGTGCKVLRDTRELRLQLLPHAPSGIDSRTLGYSLPCAAFGIDSTIFVDRCEDIAYQTPVSLKKVLAYAIAHELGHVLLRSSEHSETGIMRAHWDRATWLQGAMRGIAFDEGQARRIRSELSRME